MTGRNRPQKHDDLAARRAALQSLQDVLVRGRPHDEAFALAADKAGLTGPDRGFAKELLLTTLKRLGVIDAVLSRALTSPADKLNPEVWGLLRLGATQALFLHTPPHAVVDTAVRLAAAARHPAVRGAKGLVNAVLRRVSGDGAALFEGLDQARLSLPSWLWDSWTARFGEAVTRQIIEAQMREPALDLSLKPDADRADLTARLDAMTSPTGGLRLTPKGRIEHLPGFKAGSWWVQDAAAALPARLLRPRPGQRVVDLCAAPGGKTLQLAAAGADVMAVDVSDARLDRVRENLARTELQAQVVAADAWTLNAPPFDAVLLDAPCSATGTLRRRPEVAWRKSPADVASLAALQAELLEAAARLTAPGGVLVYAVCSLEAAEGPDQIARFLSVRDDFRLDPIGADELQGLAEARLPDGTAQTLPFMAGGVDGFFIVRLRRSV